MKDKRFAWSKRIFYLLIIVFFILVGGLILLNELEGLEDYFLVFAGFALFFLILGVVLIVLVWNLKVDKYLKLFLIMVGGSSGFFLIFVLLHNLFYGLGIYFSDVLFLRILFNIFHVGFFLAGIIGCPLVFLIGVVGVLVLLNRQKR